MSSVGPISTEGAGDQRNKSEEEKAQDLPPKFEEGKENSHQSNDSSKPLSGSPLTIPFPNNQMQKTNAVSRTAWPQPLTKTTTPLAK
jgi:hypothetical protein